MTNHIIFIILKKREYLQNMKKILYVIKTSIKDIWANNKIIFLLYFLRSLFDAIFPLISVYFTKLITQNLYPSLNISELIFIILFMSLLSLICTCVSNILNDLINYRNEKYLHREKINFSQKLNEVFYQETENPKYFDDYYRAIDFIDRGSTLHVINQLTNIITNIYIISGLIYLIKEISLIALSLCFLIWFINALINKKTKQNTQVFNDKNLNFYRKNNYFIWDIININYIKEHKIHNHIDFFINEINKSQQNLIKKMREEKKIIVKSGIVQALLNNLLTTVIYCSMIFLFDKKELIISDYTMLLAAFFSFGNTIYSIIDSTISLRTEYFYFEKFFNITKHFNENISQKKTIPRKINSIEFKNVTFNYPNNEKIILDNFSLYIDFNKTKKISIVGKNGSGKTTFIKLLMGLYKPAKGKILLNGVNIENFKVKDYYSLFSPVFQDYKIYKTTIIENISFSNDSIDNELKKMNLYNYVMSLENKEFTNISKIFDNDGIDLSGGEKQKIAISRAFKKNSSIMIFDEPTAELSIESENDLYELIYKNQKKILFFISHRLSSCKYTDLILVFDNGKIMEFGTHNELINNNSIYKDLFEMQAKFYKKVDE